MSVGVALGTQPAQAQTAQWQNYIDINGLEGTIQADVSETLDWLQQNFGGFHEILWDLKDRQADGTLDKIKIVSDDDTYYQRRTATVGLDYNPDRESESIFMPPYYLGVDGKFYSFSLNETLAHELEHGAQENGTTAENLIAAEDEIRTRVTPKFYALQSYLVSKGALNPTSEELIDPDFDRNQCLVSDYIFVYEREALAKESCNKAILQDPEYIRLHDDWFTLRLELERFNLAEENGAMDVTDALSGILGKPARGHYHDTNLFFDYMSENLPSTEVVYTDTPEHIRQSPEVGYSAPEIYGAYPLITGDPNSLEINVRQMQCEWTNEWNSGTKNITTDGWVRIDAAKMAFFKAHNFTDMTAADRVTYDAMIETLVESENKAAPILCP